ncbi:MAG: hypothetical protein IKW98_10890 [Prevotella sp.]|nr:hypothetical protein [Prevotella sp.]
MSKKNKKKTNNKETKKATKKTWSIGARTLSVWSFVLPLLALLTIAICLLVYESTFLFRVQELNLFLYTPLFFKQQMVVSGGFLTWIGTYFTQFFYHPWLGVTLLCAWWALLMWLTKKAFNIPASWAVVLLIPVAVLLLTDVDLGYWIFYLKLRGHFFVATIGCTIAVALVWLYRSLPKRFRLVFIILSTALFYPLIGFYALMATLLMGIMAWRMEDYKISRRLIDGIVAALAIIAIPLIYYRLVYYQTNIINIYWTAIPLYRIEEHHYQYYIPFYLLVAAFALMAVFYSKKRQQEVKTPILWCGAQLIVLALLVFGVWKFWYKDGNFHKELKMVHCIENLDWEGVLTIARDCDDPTRSLWMMKNLALFRLGRQGDEMYHYKNSDKACNAPFKVRMTQTGAKILYLHYGQLNFCYRWCLEDGVEYGWRVDYYRYMLKCALLNGEYAVAQKYIDILKKTKYYADWAQHYEAYIKDPSLIKKDKEFEPILHMLSPNDRLTSDNTLIELYLLNYFSNDDSDDPIYQEQTLLAALQVKDIQMFWPRFFHYANLHKGERMPVHYQEAAYLYGKLESEVDTSHMPFDKEVISNYDEFMAAAQQYSNMTEEQMKPLMYNRFGSTFYFEYFFTRGQKSY